MSEMKNDAWEQGMKRHSTGELCQKCGNDSWYFRKSGKKQGGRRCAECARIQSSSWQKANPDKAQAHIRKYKYGLISEDYENMILKQNGRCAICPKKLIKGKFSVDHDHKTGKIRGLLCCVCNLGIGMFRDNPELLKSAAIYLES